ncbi:MAG: alpha/beta fold hydrolase [Melioribacteraceae bacterium]
MTDFDPVTQDNPTIDPKFPSSLSPAVFISGRSKVLGTMFITSGEGLHPTVLLLTGFPGNEVNYDIAHMLQRQGFNVFTFYSRGSWGSEGEFSWNNLIEDIPAAVTFLKDDLCREKFQVDKNRILFLGYSMGGFAALFTSLQFDFIKNVCAIAPFNIGMFGQLITMNGEIKKYSAERMQLAKDFVNCPSPEILLKEMIQHKADWDLINHAEKLSQKNLLIISAKHDTTAPIELHHKPLVGALKLANSNVKEFILETGHSFSDKRIQLMRLISDWAKQIKF